MKSFIIFAANLFWKTFNTLCVNSQAYYIRSINYKMKSFIIFSADLFRTTFNTHKLITCEE